MADGVEREEGGVTSGTGVDGHSSRAGPAMAGPLAEESGEQRSLAESQLACGLGEAGQPLALSALSMKNKHDQTHLRVLLRGGHAHTLEI